MADAIVTLPLDRSQPAHLPPAGRTVSCNQHRRAALVSLAGIAAGATAVTVKAPDPVLALLDRAEVLQRQGDTLAAVGDSEGAGHFWHLRWLADDDVLAVQPTTMGGLTAQLRILADRLHGGTRGREDGDDLFRLADFAEALGGRLPV